MKYGEDDIRFKKTDDDADEAGETVAAAHLSHEGQPADVAAHAKICCVCGANVAGERRYKDSQGRYWCCDCVKSDGQQKKSAACPDCGQAFAAKDLVDHEGARICAACRDQRIKKAKREAARKAAAEEAARLQLIRRKRLMVTLSVVVALAVGYAVFRIVTG